MDGNKCKVNLGYIVCFGSAMIRLQRNRNKNMMEREREATSEMNGIEIR